MANFSSSNRASNFLTVSALWDDPIVIFTVQNHTFVYFHFDMLYRYYRYDHLHLYVWHIFFHSDIVAIIGDCGLDTSIYHSSSILSLYSCICLFWEQRSFLGKISELGSCSEVILILCWSLNISKSRDCQKTRSPIQELKFAIVKKLRGNADLA